MPAAAPGSGGGGVSERTVEWFADERGIDRRLKVSWHPELRLVVLSVWRGDECAATFRLPLAEAARLVAALANALGDAARSTASGPVRRLRAVRRPRHRRP